MSLEVVVDCPLGSKCESLGNGKIRRCAWYIKVRGKHPQSEDIVEEWGCAMAWLPVLVIENAQTNRGQTQALESFRNEMVKGQQVFNALVASALERRQRVLGVSEERDSKVREREVIAQEE